MILYGFAKRGRPTQAAVAECSGGNSRRSLVAAGHLRHDAAEISHLLRTSWNLAGELWTSWQASCGGSRGSWSHHSRPRSVGCRETDSHVTAKDIDLAPVLAEMVPRGRRARRHRHQGARPTQIQLLPGRRVVCPMRAQDLVSLSGPTHKSACLTRFSHRFHLCGIPRRSRLV